MSKFARNMLVLMTLFVIGEAVLPMAADAQHYRHHRRHHRHYHHR
jgi:hypothetical protein